MTRYAIQSLFTLRRVRVLFQPDTVGSLPSLEELWLDCNEISELPPVRQPPLHL